MNKKEMIINKTKIICEVDDKEVKIVNESLYPIYFSTKKRWFKELTIAMNFDFTKGLPPIYEQFKRLFDASNDEIETALKELNVFISNFVKVTRLENKHIVAHLKEAHHFKVFRQGEESSKLVVFDKTHYKNAYHVIDQMTRLQCNDKDSTRDFTGDFNDIIARLKAHSDLLCEKDDFDKDNGLINVNNGILDLEKGEIVDEHSHKFLSLTKWDIDYDKDATCPDFDAFMLQILPDETARQLVLEEMGFILYKKYSHQNAFLWLGKGANGKGVLIRILKKIFGSHNTTSITVKELMDAHMRVSLVDKLAVFCGEVSDTLLEDADLFKKLTGEDDFLVNPKFKEPYDLTNNAKMFFAANEFPNIAENTYGIKRRWIVTEFPLQLAKKDIKPNLSDELLKEKNGIFNRICEAYASLKKRGMFYYDDELTEEWFHSNDTTSVFIDEVFDKGGHTQTSLLYTAYRIHAEENGNRPMSSRKLKQRLENIGHLQTRNKLYSCFDNITPKREWLRKLAAHYKKTGKPCPEQLSMFKF